MKYSPIAIVIGFCAMLTACHGDHEDEFDDILTLRDITTAIVPTRVLEGDREFDGNGPILDTRVELTIERSGRAIFANVTFSAREDGGDGSLTEIGPVRFEVWRWNPSDSHFVLSINSPTVSTISHHSAPGCGLLGCGVLGPSEDGGLIVTVAPDTPGPVRDITLLGDTTGDDISTDDNPEGDTSIRGIRFNPIEVTMVSTMPVSETANASLTFYRIPWMNFCERGEDNQGNVWVSGNNPHLTPVEEIPAVLVVHDATLVSGGEARANFMLRREYNTSVEVIMPASEYCDGCVEYHLEARNPADSLRVDTRMRSACVRE